MTTIEGKWEDGEPTLNDQDLISGLVSVSGAKSFEMASCMIATLEINVERKVSPVWFFPRV